MDSKKWERVCLYSQGIIFLDIADIVVARLPRIANLASENEIQESLKDFCSWGRYKEKLKAWFKGVYLLV